MDNHSRHLIQVMEDQAVAPSKDCDCDRSGGQGEDQLPQDRDRVKADIMETKAAFKPRCS